MGYTLEDILKDMKEFKDNVEYYLSCIGYTPTDIDNMLLDLEQKLREAQEYVS
jgi:hypothetical protein